MSAQRLQDNKRTIGEVLALLKQEFDDISISKIRFLESQGLVEPERTSSGYRKFTEDDVARLRYILRQQREHFLPLKVIKGRLDRNTTASDTTHDVGSANSASGVHESSSQTVIDVTNNVVTGVAGGASLDRRELLGATGLSEGQLRELESYGLLQGRKSGETVTYDESALVVAKIAARLLAFGTEVRHLRIYKTASDREADLYRQLTVPVRGSRNTQAKMEAQARLDELTGLGTALRSELVRQALT